jgi:hypothetical protein
MAGSKSGVLEANQGTESKVANPTNSNSQAVDSNLQAVAIGPLVKFIQWAVQNWDKIAAIFGTLWVAKDTITAAFSPKGTAEYKSLTATGRNSIDVLSTALTKAAESGDKTAFVAALQESAKVYEQQALMTTDSNMREKLQARATQLNTFASNVQSGVIPMDAGMASQIKSDSKTDEKGLDFKDMSVNTGKDSSTDLMTKSLTKDLQNILRTTLKLLNVPELNDKNAQKVAQKMLELGADTKVAEQVLTAYYENVKGLSHEDSEAKAKGIVADAAKANENPQAKDNEAGKEAEKQQKNQADQGMGA